MTRRGRRLAFEERWIAAEGRRPGGRYLFASILRHDGPPSYRWALPVPEGAVVITVTGETVTAYCLEAER